MTNHEPDWLDNLYAEDVGPGPRPDGGRTAPRRDPGPRATKTAHAVRELETAAAALRRAREPIATGDLRFLDEPTRQALDLLETALETMLHAHEGETR